MMTIDILLTGILQGLILALVTYAVMIPFRLLNFPDLSAEGAYPLGGAICASLLLLGFPPLLAIVFSALGSGLMGIATSLIHLRLNVNTLLAGIIVSTMIYSVNLRIMGRPNIALFNSASFFVQNNTAINILILVIILIIMIVPLALYLKTQSGLRLRAVGLNPEFACRQGVSVAKYTVFGLFIAGCFSGLSGSLMIQLQSYMDVGMGVGIVIHALAALMIGEKILSNDTLTKQLLAPLVGALLYQQIQGAALAFGLAPSDLKFFTGAVVLLVIAMQTRRKK